MIRVNVFDEEASYAPFTCFQCNEAWCMQACPVNAIATDPATGAKLVIAALCVGCHLCTLPMRAAGFQSCPPSAHSRTGRPEATIPTLVEMDVGHVGNVPHTNVPDARQCPDGGRR